MAASTISMHGVEKAQKTVKSSWYIIGAFTEMVGSLMTMFFGLQALVIGLLAPLMFIPGMTDPKVGPWIRVFKWTFTSTKGILLAALGCVIGGGGAVWLSWRWMHRAFGRIAEGF